MIPTVGDVIRELILSLAGGFACAFGQHHKRCHWDDAGAWRWTCIRCLKSDVIYEPDERKPSWIG